MRKINMSTLLLIAMFVFPSLMTIAYRETRESHIRFRESYEELARSNARRTLQVLKGELLDSIKSGEVDPYDDNSLSAWASKYLDPVRNLTENSDAFMIELGSERFLWDGSPDCMKGAGKVRTMRDEVVDQEIARNYYRSNRIELPTNGVITASNLKLLDSRHISNLRSLGAITHHDVELAENAYNMIRDNYDTRQGDNVYWRFEKSREYLEWVIVPQPRVGFGGEKTSSYGTRNTSYRGLVIVLGTQEDELLSAMKGVDRGFYVIRVLIIVSSFVVMISSLIMIRMVGKFCPMSGTKVIRKGVDENAE